MNQELRNNTNEQKEMQYKQTKYNKTNQQVSNRTGSFAEEYLFSGNFETVEINLPCLPLSASFFLLEKLMFAPKRCSKDVIDAKRLDRHLWVNWFISGCFYYFVM